MEVVAALALTTSATMTWVALRHWSHQTVTPALVYLGSVLTAFATYRWIEVFGHNHYHVINLTFITLVQVGITLVMVAGKHFHEDAAKRRSAGNGDERYVGSELAVSAELAGALLAQKAEAAGALLADKAEEAGRILASKAEEAGDALAAKVAAIGEHFDT